MEENKNELIDKQKESLVSTYDDVSHLNEVIKEILAYHEKDGLTKFEEISIYIKRKMLKLSFQYMKKAYSPQTKLELTPYEQNIIKKITTSKVKSLEQVNVLMDDILTQARMFEWAGCGFNKSEWCKIRFSIKKLLIETKVSSIKFFGKIFGKDSDYYVLYGIQPELTTSLSNNPRIEKRGGEGLNRFVFWVSNNVLEDWYELPDVTQDQMLASRQFKYILTGDLKAKVNSFRYFPGIEAHFLKCQILRILHGSFIVPADYLQVKSGDGIPPELENKLVENKEDFTVPTMEELISPEKWVHEHANILICGRIIHSPALNDEEKEKQETTDKYIERLTSIQNDEPFPLPENKVPDQEPVAKPVWLLRQIGDPQQYTKGDGNISYNTLVVRNLRWPGYHCVFKNGEFSSIYIGNGVKFGGNLFTPQDSGMVNSDPEGFGEQIEPNEPPKKPEEEKKDDEVPADGQVNDDDN